VCFPPTLPRFTKWAKQYGGLFSLKLGTGTAVVLTDRRLVKQLIDKKSNIYSNRPPSYVSHDLITGGDHLLVMQYGKVWRSFRKMIHQYFMESMVEKEHVVLQNAEAVQMIRDYLLHPEEHMLHPKRYSNSIIMSLGGSFPNLLPMFQNVRISELHIAVTNDFFVESKIKNHGESCLAALAKDVTFHACSETRDVRAHALHCCQPSVVVNPLFLPQAWPQIGASFRNFWPLSLILWLDKQPMLRALFLAHN